MIPFHNTEETQYCVMEQDVFHYLLKGTQPIIIALARGLKEKIEPELIRPARNHTRIA